MSNVNDILKKVKILMSIILIFNAHGRNWAVLDVAL